MKKILLLSILLLLLLTSCQKEVSESEFLELFSNSEEIQWGVCFEKENGVFGTFEENKFTKSYQITNGCKNRVSSFEDSKEFLVFSCEKEKPVLKSNLCISGCFKNACVPLSSCIDSDGGKNFFNSGKLEVTDKVGNKDILEDTCYPGNLLGELHCITSYEVGFEEYVCPFGCVQGKCLEEKDKLAIYEKSFGEELTVFPEKVSLSVIPQIAVVNQEISLVATGIGKSFNKPQIRFGDKAFQLFDDGFHQDGLAGDNIYALITKVSEPGKFQLSLSYTNKNNIKESLDLNKDLIVIEQNEGECEYFASSQDNAKINIVITAVGYENEVEVIERVVDYKDQFGGIFSVEPFKSNKELFNVWYVSAENVENLILPDYLQELDVADELQKGYSLLSSCQKPQQFSLILYNSPTKTENGNDLSYGQYRYAYTYYDPKTKEDPTDAVHEFVHAFAGLTDEYVTDSVNNKIINEQCYYSPHVNCYSINNGVKYSCQETVESYNDCLVNAPWKDYFGDGCGKDGAIDCKPIDEDFNIEVNCFLGCGRQKNLYRSTFSSGMRKISVPFKLGPTNERLVCQSIKDINGFVKGTCLKYNLS
ncbi:hypothetical protein HOE37_00045 [Candidatus Woesearchaeota archaeon]|jgi:hypothetical protein|nr:hypothetical protein [Candidatus Woesearchaeota archaeon]MBT4110227.1 hypothetical protein [Candidatus Woesearchaeota archaeon]MBT4336249.1 hypothetical protein [Candidatus Woesearchaeota archaeon]MBT4468772.1 hypothetical protein [Candidatus Woesearchaeota archaeon]MBT6744909.1 hypothetical protein [Candidatus Woesearchaeota archaeon]